MKRLALVLALAALPAAVVAQNLVVGVVRDQDGAVVARARVTGRDAAGRFVAAGTAAADGTFALDGAGIAKVDVACDYCLARHGAAATVPLVIFVTRFRALALDTPSEPDLAALPYARAENAVALQPFTFTSRPGNLNLGLDRGHGLVSTAGIASYRIADGGNALTSLPDRYLERFTMLAPTQGFRYGSYADGGTFDVEPLADERAALRTDGGPAESIAARYATPGLAGAVGASYGSGVRQARADVIGTSPLLGGTLRSVASLAGSGSETYAALGAQYATASRRYETVVDANATRSTLDSVTGTVPDADGSSIFTGVRVRNRGPLNLEFGGRFRTSTGYYAAPYGLYQVAGLQQEAALYTDFSFASAGNTLSAAAGLSRIYRSGSVATDTTFAPIGSLQYAYALGAHFAVTAGASALPRIPTLAEEGGYYALYRSLIPIDRNALVETGISYTDRSRVRAEVDAFRQRISGAETTVDAGVGVSLTWQIAPGLSLRGWAMQPSQNLGGQTYYSAAAPLRTSSVWLTYDYFVRFDAIYYGGHIDGDFNIPLSGDATLRIGRDSSSGAPRYSFGLRYMR